MLSLPRKTAQLLLHREALTHIAEKLAISTSTVYHKLKQFQFKDDFSILPEVLSWDEFSYQKGKLAFIAQDYNTKKSLRSLITDDKQPFAITFSNTLKKLEKG